MAYIATAISNAGYEIEILDIDADRYSDEEVEQLLKEKKYDVAAMGCIVTGFKTIRKLSKIIKKYKNVPIVVGNSVADSITEILLNKTNIDYAVIGEGDVTIIELLDAIKNNDDISSIEGISYKENGNIITTYRRKAIENIDSIPFINWDLFNVEYYIQRSKSYVHEPYPVPYDEIRSLPINTARGCPYKCTFCYHVFKNDKYRVRSPEHICEEIKLLKHRYNINYLMFYDELTFSTKKQAERFVEIFLENDLNISWNASIRAGIFKKEDLSFIKELRRAGCLGIGYSLESANEDILIAMNKKISVDDFIEQTRVLQLGDIAPSTSIVIGYPQETKESLQQTFDVCFEADIYPSVGYLLPLPGTPIYDYALESGVIKDEFEYLLNMGDRQDFRINLTKMSQSEIEEIVNNNLQKISDKLGFNLDKSMLIKTGHYKHKRSDDNLSS